MWCSTALRFARHWWRKASTSKWRLLAKSKVSTCFATYSTAWYIKKAVTVVEGTDSFGQGCNLTCRRNYSWYQVPSEVLNFVICSWKQATTDDVWNGQRSVEQIGGMFALLCTWARILCRFVHTLGILRRANLWQYCLPTSCTANVKITSWADLGTLQGSNQRWWIQSPFQASLHLIQAVFFGSWLMNFELGFYDSPDFKKVVLERRRKKISRWYPSLMRWREAVALVVWAFNLVPGFRGGWVQYMYWAPMTTIERRSNRFLPVVLRYVISTVSRIDVCNSE